MNEVRKLPYPSKLNITIVKIDEQFCLDHFIFKSSWNYNEDLMNDYYYQTFVTMFHEY
jgi:hypothetical protein